MEKAIQKAKEAGYIPDKEFETKGLFLTDPKFWEFLGKAENWGRPIFSQGIYMSEDSPQNWFAEWSNFNFHLSHGGKVDDFFEKLFR